jgi:hypothetical protein
VCLGKLKIIEGSWNPTQHGAVSRNIKLREASNILDYSNPRLPFLFHFQTSISNPFKNSSPSNPASTSSSAKFTSLVTFHYHDFRVERLCMWWNLFSLEEQVRIKDDIGRTTSLLTMEVN